MREAEMGAGLVLILGVVVLAFLIGAGLVALMSMRKVAARQMAAVEKEIAAIRERASTEAAEMVSQAKTHLADAQAQARQLEEDADRRISQQLAGLDEAKEGLSEHRREVREELAQLRVEHSHRETRLAERESRIEREHQNLVESTTKLQHHETSLNVRATALADAEHLHHSELQRIAGLTADQAREEVLAEAEHQARLDAAILSRNIEQSARREAQQKARLILVGAMERLASDQTTESTVTSVSLPSEDLKGRVIGREGRNIRSFEQVTGANLVIDDTPDVVLISCFDPVRREAARLALTELVTDGRIHPTRIEEAHARAMEMVAQRCQQAADDALLEVGITDLAPTLVETLGTLRYRTSYGQNVLKHLVECAHLARMIAAELGLDQAVCARAAFLHDIGKALSHESEGGHAIVGADLARRHGEHPDIVHAIEAHHNEVEPETVEAHLVQVVDAISGARPGARRESVENFMKRMTQLENLARSHHGVAKVYAMQAGRDVRVMVRPDVLDDLESQVLARSIAKQIEEELTYPGQVKVTVIRESRASETAR